MVNGWSVCPSVRPSVDMYRYLRPVLPGMDRSTDGWMRMARWSVRPRAVLVTPGSQPVLVHSSLYRCLYARGPLSLSASLSLSLSAFPFPIERYRRSATGSRCPLVGHAMRGVAPDEQRHLVEIRSVLWPRAVRIHDHTKPHPYRTRYSTSSTDTTRSSSTNDSTRIRY